MTLRQKLWRLVGVALLAALIAGSITGTLLTIGDQAWPERGGLKAVFQISALFSAYAFPLALAVGAALAVTVSPIMARSGADDPLSFIGIGLLCGLLVHLMVDLAIRERIDSLEDFLGGSVAGGMAGLLWWWSVQRHEAEGAR